MELYQTLEEKLGKWIGSENVVCTASGTASLHIALEALRLPAGSKVVTNALSMIACPRAISLAGLVPVFVDCLNDLRIDLDALDTALANDSSIRAILAVHIYGRRANMETIHLLAKKYGDLKVIEDMAEVHGVKPHPQTDAAAYSFFKNKVVAGQEGGCVAFKDPEHAGLARKLKNLGFTDKHDFWHIPGGHNYRMSNVHASLILKSLANVDKNLLKRKQIERWYDEVCPEEWKMPTRESVWVYDIRVPGMMSASQDEVIKALMEAGIRARHCFKPNHLQDEYKACLFVGEGRSELLFSEIFYLPVIPGETTKAKCAEAINIVKSVLGD